VIIESGRLVFRQSGAPVDTEDGTKWIFVLSTTRNLYVGEKKKGQFQHSSFLAGGAATAAGRLVAHNGVLEVYIYYIYSSDDTCKHGLHMHTFLKLVPNFYMVI
jgi:hypothetical protein